MKKLIAFSLFTFLVTLNAVAQKSRKFPNLITDQKKLNKVEYEFKEIDYMDSINCQSLTFSEPGVTIYLPIVDPISSNQVKDSARAEMLLQLKNISNYQSCFKGKALYFKLTDGLMLTYDEIDDCYNKGEDCSKMYDLNVKRFVEKYGYTCDELFPGTKIYVENYSW